MRTLFRLIIIVLTLLSLSACSYITGNKSYYTRQKYAYLQAQNDPALKLAKGDQIVGREDYYIIPSVSGTPKKEVSTIPPGSLSAYEAAHKIKPSKTLTAIPVVSKSQVILRTDGDGYPYLLLQEPLNTAWTDLYKAIKGSDYSITKSDNIEYTYYIKIEPSSAKSKQPAQNYKVQLTPQNQATKVVIANTKGSRVSVTDANMILTTIEDSLLGRQPLPQQTFWQKVFG